MKSDTSSRRLPKEGLVVSLLVASTLIVMSASLSSAHALSLLAINQTHTGLVAKDSLTSGNPGNWILSGSAVLQGAPTTSSEDAQGLHLGVKAALSGQWAGYYAQTPDTNAYLFHAVLTLPYSTIPDQSFNTGLYVQTAPLAAINYVTCDAGVNKQGYFWAVVQASGGPNSASQFTNLWFQWMNNQPLTRDCTIITNGSNLLKVYLDGTLVFSSATMNLNMPPPFNAFLEVQSTYAGQMLFGVYKDYYATSSDSVTVTNAPPSSTVQIEDPSGNVLASSQADLSGNAVLNIGRYHLPLQANVRAYTLGAMVASTPSPVSIWGGDAYSAAISTV